MKTIISKSYITLYKLTMENIMFFVFVLVLIFFNLVYI